MTDDQMAGQAQDTDTTHQDAPAELRGLIDELQDGPLDEDRVMDEEEGESEGDETFVDADELFSALARIQTMLEEQAKEIRGLRREMRELREGQGSVPSARPQREDRGERSGGYQGNREGTFRPREDRGERSGGYQGNREGGNREGGFRPREDRGERSGGYQGNREGGFNRDRNDRGGYQGNREGGNREGGFRPREDRPSGDRPQGESDFRPRARADRGWSGGNREK